MPNGNGMALPPGATLVDPGSMRLPPGATLVSSGAAQQPDQTSPFLRGISAVGEQIKAPFQATAEELSRLNRAAGQGQLFQQMGQDMPPYHAGSIPAAVGQGYTRGFSDLLSQLNPVVAKKDAQGQIDWPATIGATIGKAATMAVPLLMGAPEAAPSEALSAGRYSDQADKIAASLKPSAASRLDMPAIANSALPALKESFADLGAAPQDFQGREGTLLFKKTVQHAIDLTENRAQQVLQPIMQNDTPPAMLARSPDLVDWIGKDPESITNQMVNDARIEANKQLTRGNYFLKPRSQQIAAPEATIDAFNVGNQARDVLYSQAQDATGYNVRPLRAMESDLINLADVANSTHNWLSGKEATFQATGPVQRFVGGLKAAVAVKASPLSALSVGERPGLFSPLRDFNSNMQDVFQNVVPQPANLDMGITAPAQGFVPPLPRQLPSRVIPAPPVPARGLLPPTASSANFGQTTVQGTPFIPGQAPLALPGGPAPIYVEPTPVPFNRMLPRKGVPATRAVGSLVRAIAEKGQQ